MAAVLGIEPRMTESKSVVIPFHHTATELLKFLKNDKTKKP